jgi:DNA-binding NarL/FixJ family response regulator
VRVIVVEDLVLTRVGIVRLLTESGVTVVGETGDVDQVLGMTERLRPDAAVLDIRMPPTNTDEGLAAAALLKETMPEIGVIVLSHYVEPAYALRLIEENPEGVGYLLKERVIDGAVLVDALQRVIEGETVVDPLIVSRLLSRKRKQDPLATLSPREREVLGLVAEGLSNRAIANRLFLTDRTVESHMTSIFGKLGLERSPDQHRRVLAVLTLLRA